ncbi:hypothetical protein [Jannaschia rubra]|uniref:Uncharacterized protein n=1 Tax=Jannaschia rubra TaxID=282197 RepID=A0A0M6XMG2_9RHOB|nr:hypothetical protein [Jannaschia rubra]CTQ31373.1 hypothetical protein JAN5088_00129 [Jannaschia rubra]SFF80778.1 hypothetical protein SAMN04488517_101288 [Jannaschia rubra]
MGPKEAIAAVPARSLDLESRVGRSEPFRFPAFAGLFFAAGLFLLHICFWADRYTLSALVLTAIFCFPVTSNGLRRLQNGSRSGNRMRAGAVPASPSVTAPKAVFPRFCAVVGTTGTPLVFSFDIFRPLPWPSCPGPNLTEVPQ